MGGDGVGGGRVKVIPLQERAYDNKNLDNMKWYGMSKLIYNWAQNIEV